MNGNNFAHSRMEQESEMNEFPSRFNLIHYSLETKIKKYFLKRFDDIFFGVFALHFLSRKSSANADLMVLLILSGRQKDNRQCTEI